MIFHHLKVLKKHPRIDCPDCATLMIPYQCGGVIVDRCAVCQGIWFDKKELGAFRDSLKEFSIESIEVDLSQIPAVHSISSCPRCKKMLVDGKYDYKTKVTLKRCERCEGIWLNQGELLKFIDLVRIAKIIEPDIRVVAQELMKFNQISENQKDFNQTMEKLNRPVQRFDYLDDFPMILPLYDENPRSKKPWVTTLFIFFMVSIMVLLINQDSNHVFLSLGFIPGNLQVSGFITSMFLHSGFFHLIGNLFFLWTFGDNVEDVLGPLKFILFYFFCGIAASLTHFVTHQSSMIPAVGASGAISGLMGGYLYLFPKVNIKTLVVRTIVDIPVWVYLGLWMFSQLIYTTFFWGTNGSSIAFGAHVGGFSSGFILMWFLEKMNYIRKARTYRA